MTKVTSNQCDTLLEDTASSRLMLYIWRILARDLSQTQMVYNFDAHNRHYEWDPAKARSNLEKHDIDFASVSEFEWETAVIRRSDRHSETRSVAYGYIGHRLHSLAFTIRRDRIRVISFRKADEREMRYYAQAKT